MKTKKPLPEGVERELKQAIERTGKTAALRVAKKRLPVILAMRPEQFEEYQADVKRNKKRP